MNSFLKSTIWVTCFLGLAAIDTSWVLAQTAPPFIAAIPAPTIGCNPKWPDYYNPFTEVATGLPSLSSGASAWGDYDHDGDLDLALAGNGVAYTTIYRNTGGFFSNAVSNLPNRSNNDLAWVDYNNDGNLDLTECGWDYSGYTPKVYLFQNNATNAFSILTLPGITNVADGSLAWGDYDNDGDLDLLLTGDPDTYHVFNGISKLYRNERGRFVDSGVLLPGVCAGAAAWLDFDRDGHLDIVLAGQTGATEASALTKLFRNDGNGRFTEVPTSLPAVAWCALAVADWDNDGYPDLTLAGRGTNGAPLTCLYRNDGQGAFVDSGVSLPGICLGALAWGDYDNDGFPDLVLTGLSGSDFSIPITRVYHNNAGQSFTDLGGTFPRVYLQTASWGDYDNDGDLDLLIGSRLFCNHFNAPNSPPSPPTALAATIQPDGVRLSWAAATDAQSTNAAALSYNLRVGTAPGGYDIVNPQSDLQSGYHWLPQAGNCSSATSWCLLDLTNGTYYWSVQAMDSVFAGSTFAAEGTFQLSRPTISVISPGATAPNTPFGPIAFSVSDAQTPASNLVVTVASSNPSLVPEANLMLSGQQTSRTLWVIPASNRVGTVTITLTACNELGQCASRSFDLTVGGYGVVATLSDNYQGTVAWGDFNNDGWLDLVCGSLLVRNEGNGRFTPLYNAFPGMATATLAVWGDFNNDGYLDLLLSGGNLTRLYRNNGNGTFSDVAAGLPAVTCTSAAWGDYDNDGDLDLILVSSSSTRVFRNNGDETFTGIATGINTVGPGSAAWGDFDNDGFLDVLLAGSKYLRLYKNKGDGSFYSVPMELPGVYFADSSSVACADFDGDGYLDFALTGCISNTVGSAVTRLYRNNGNGTFSNLYPVAASGLLGVWAGAVAWGDYDNDGDLDLAVSGESAQGTPITRIYRNDAGSFVDAGLSLPGLRNASIAWGDFDNDGRLDLALSGQDAHSGNRSQIYRNFAEGLTNQPPKAPTLLSVTALGTHSVRLSWNAAVDPNQSAGLTYNVRLGTRPGAGDVLSAMSANDGWPRLARFGNAGPQPNLILTNLPGVPLYWSVQAIDAAFAGSPFAAEAAFTLTNVPPVAYNQAVTTEEDIQKGLLLSGEDNDDDPLLYEIIEPPLYGTLFGTAPNLVYQPRTNYFGLDQFRFRVKDRTTNSLPATVSITVTPVPDLPGATLSLEALDGAPGRLSFQVEPWQTYQLQISEDLLHWTVVTNVFTTNQLLQWIDAEATNHSQRFYRLAVPQ